jgi:hypothetical protein
LFERQRGCCALPEHLQTWMRILLRSFLSLFHFPEKEAKVPFGPDLEACSLVGQLFPFSVIGATLVLVSSAIST